ESALEALRHFTGNASHQLRTPLAIVRTQLAIASRASDPQAARQAVAKADAAIADGERILGQLLLMARIDAATRSASLQDTDLSALAQTLTAEHVPLAAEAGIDLGFEGQDAVHVLAEPLLIGELLKNLITNSLLYAGRGAEVTVRVVRQAEAVVLEVEDNGPGIPPDLRDGVLKRFDRGNRSDASGSGLGLPIVEEIARLHGASLSMHDGPSGRGLVVRLRFATTA
ncbi:MAG: sensor histidine kinase, partial [Pseudorhizobium sp.]